MKVRMIRLHTNQSPMPYEEHRLNGDIGTGTRGVHRTPEIVGAVNHWPPVLGEPVLIVAPPLEDPAASHREVWTTPVASLAQRADEPETWFVTTKSGSQYELQEVCDD